MSDNIKFLSILKNGHPVSLSVSEIFDKKTYDNLKIVTYVSSPSFLSKTCKGFNSVELILGIDDEKVRTDFATNMCKYLRTEEIKEFYNKLDKDMRVKIISDEFKVYFSHNYKVHDKIYLLENSKTKENRIIIGSANLSQSAFSDSKQFETIEIYDNDSERYEYYLERFNMIKNNCVDYFPKTLKESVNIISSDEIEIIPVISSEKDYDILMDQVEKLGKIVVKDDVFENIDDSKKQFTYVLEEVKRDQEVLKILTKKK